MSEITLGTATFGHETDSQEAQSIISSYLDAGGNALDTADVYNGGLAEEICGRAIEGRREEVLILAKTGLATVGRGKEFAPTVRRDLRAWVEASLTRLRTSWIDVLELHVLPPAADVDVVAEAMAEIVDLGLARFLAAGNAPAWRLLSLHERLESVGGLAKTSACFSLAVRDCERDLLPMCVENDIGFFAWGVLAGGILSGKYEGQQGVPQHSRAAGPDRRWGYPMKRRWADAAAVIPALSIIAKARGVPMHEVAANWALARPGVTSAIVGARTHDQWLSVERSQAWQLSEAEIAELERRSTLDRGFPYEFWDELGVS